jgi:hypothetical protein
VRHGTWHRRRFRQGGCRGGGHLGVTCARWLF